MKKDQYVEFDPQLLDAVAQALFIHDEVPVSWAKASPMTQRDYIGFAQVALQAMYDNAMVEEQYQVCGSMPIEGHSDYKFCSAPLPTLEAAEALHADWVNEHGGQGGATCVIEHVVQVRLNTYRYWTQEDLDEINAAAKRLAKAIAPYVD